MKTSLSLTTAAIIVLSGLTSALELYARLLRDKSRKQILTRVTQKCTALDSKVCPTGFPSRLGQYNRIRIRASADLDNSQPLEHGTPWGDRTVANCHPKSPPNTGVTRYYDFTATRTTGAPDGLGKSLILINGVFPGPLIEANWGDWIEGSLCETSLLPGGLLTPTVKLTNKITGPEEGTSIHYHGLLQTETPWYIRLGLGMNFC